MAHARLRSRLDAIRLRGDPLLPEDFSFPSLPDDQNAACYYRQALAKAVDDPITPSRLLYSPSRMYPPFSARWHRLADKAIRANQTALGFVHKASEFPRADWREQLNAPAFGEKGFPEKLPCETAPELSQIVADAAMQQFEAGEHEAAIQHVREILHLANAINQMPRPFLARDYAHNIELLALSRLEMMTPELQIVTAGQDAVPTPSSSPSGQGVPESEVRALIAQLLDDTADNASGVQAALVNRMLDLHTMLRARDRHLLTRPFFELQAAKVLDIDTPIIAAAKAENRPQLQKIASGIPTPPSPVLGLPFPLSWSAEKQNKPVDFAGVFISDFVTAKTWDSQRFDCQAERKLAATALAIRTYRLKHGAWPATLADLVPSIVQSIPIDPLSPAGAPIGYMILPHSLPDGSDRYLVFATPFDSGVSVSPPPTPVFDEDVFSPHIRFRDLCRWEPANDLPRPNIDPQPRGGPGFFPWGGGSLPSTSPTSRPGTVDDDP